MRLSRSPLSTAHDSRAFSLVEVALAIGLVAFVLLGLLGLMVVGINSSRESTVETTLSQIALHVSSNYDSSSVVDGATSYQKFYSYNGTPLTSSSASDIHYTTNVSGSASAGSSKLHLITIEITSPIASDPKRAIQTSAIIP